ncbi:MAG: hypothetical protein VX821_03580, partial [Verrucomicrobiota bacterium]|nr:hypothetical protein [Verrucomicrobiota bacterium]
MEYETDRDGIETLAAEYEGEFSEDLVTSFDEELGERVSERYSYAKRDENTAQLSILPADGGEYNAELFFESNRHGNGQWTDTYERDTVSGRLTFEILNMPEEDHHHDHHVPLELPDEGRKLLEDRYKFEDGSAIGYWEEERFSPETGEMEIVVHLDNGVEVIFDKDGNFSREVDPYAFFQQEEFDAGLSFNPLASKWVDDNNNSGKFSFEGKTKGSSPVSVDIRRVDEREPEYGSILYRISLTNGDANETGPTLAQLDLNGTDLELGATLSLTFNYDAYEPKYLIVSGAEVSGYRNTYPGWDGTPGSFTIKAKTVAPVASASNPNGSIASTFGITVQMGGERHYGGAIFETNVVSQDVGPAE